MPVPIDPEVMSLVKLKLQEKFIAFDRTVPHLKYFFNVPWDDAYVSGGCIASLIQGDKPKDYDVYFKTEPKGLRELLLTEYMDEIADVQEQYREYMGTDGKMITENAITMIDGISFIFRHYANPVDMKKTFDYLHCTPHYEITQNKLYISQAAYWACYSKLLIVNNEDKIEQWRTNKFLRRGYREHVIKSF